MKSSWAVDISIKLAKLSRFFVLRCSHTSIYAALRCSKIKTFCLRLAKYPRPLFFILFISLGMVACNSHPSNYPHGKYLPEQNVFFATFTEPPKTLDPAKSYSADESIFVSQIYEPPLQYKYLTVAGNTPAYQLEPLTLREMPEVAYYDENENLLSNTVSPAKIAYSIYTLRLKPHISYQPHPAFALDQNGQYLYHHLSQKQLKKINSLNDFALTGSRELTAEDYAYQIKRLAAPWVNSPIYGVMKNYVVGLEQLHAQLQALPAATDLRQYPMEGVKVIDPYTLQIKIKGYYLEPLVIDEKPPTGGIIEKFVDKN